MNSKHEEIIKKIKFLLNNSEPEVRIKGIQVCKKIGPLKCAVILLIFLKKEKHPDVLDLGISVVSNYKFEDLANIFMQICKSENTELQLDLAWLIGMIGNLKYLPYLKKLSSLNVQGMDEIIKKSVKMITENDKSPEKNIKLDLLWRDKLSDSDVSQKFSAISKIAEIKPNWAADALEEALKTETNEKVKASLLMALSEFAGSDHIKLFASYLENSNTRVRANAVEALEKCAHDKCLPIFGMMLNDPNNRVRANAILALKSYPYISIKNQLNKMINTNQKLMQLSAIYVIDILGKKELYSLLDNVSLGLDNTVFQKTENLLTRFAEKAPEFSAILEKLRNANKEADHKESSVETIETVMAEDINEEEILLKLADLITSFTDTDLTEKKKIIFNLRTDVSVLNYNFLKYISKTSEPSINSLTHMALRTYESKKFPDYLSKLRNLNIKVSKEDSLFGITNIAFDHEKSIIQLNKDLTTREKQYKISKIWGFKISCDSLVVQALREDTQDIILKSLALGATLEKAYICFFQDKFNIFTEGKKSLDSTKMILNLKKERTGYDKFSPTGELLWSISQPRYLLFLITSSNVVLFLRDSLEHTRCTIKSISYDYIDSVRLKQIGNKTDLILESGGKSLYIPQLSSQDAKEAEELITLALS